MKVKLGKAWNGYFAICPKCGKLMAQMMDGKGVRFGCIYCPSMVVMNIDEYDAARKEATP